MITATTTNTTKPLVPTWDHELGLYTDSYTLIAGVDEAGRGAWAGPLVAGAVIFPHPDVLSSSEAPGLAREIYRLRDSKVLTAEVREELLPAIHAVALAVGIGVVSPGLVDAIGLGPANRLAMVRAVRDLGTPPDFLLVDAFKLPQLRMPYRPIIKGDACCITIAAASIVAKVTRDRIMCRLDAQHPGYHFSLHKGYGTRSHADAIARLGVLPLHRHSYAPIKAILCGHETPIASDNN